MRTRVPWVAGLAWAGTDLVLARFYGATRRTGRRGSGGDVRVWRRPRRKTRLEAVDGAADRRPRRPAVRRPSSGAAGGRVDRVRSRSCRRRTHGTRDGSRTSSAISASTSSSRSPVKAPSSTAGRALTLTAIGLIVLLVVLAAIFIRRGGASPSEPLRGPRSVVLMMKRRIIWLSSAPSSCCWRSLPSPMRALASPATRVRDSRRRTARSSVSCVSVDPAPPNAQSTTYHFKVDDVFKGDIGSTVDVESSTNGASCGFEVPRGQQMGFFLDREGSVWRGGLCGQIAPEDLRKAAAPLPKPNGTGPLSVPRRRHVRRRPDARPRCGRQDAAIRQGRRQDDATVRLSRFDDGGRGRHRRRAPVPHIRDRARPRHVRGRPASHGRRVRPSGRGPATHRTVIACRNSSGSDVVVFGSNGYATEEDVIATYRPRGAGRRRPSSGRARASLPGSRRRVRRRTSRRARSSSSRSTSRRAPCATSRRSRTPPTPPSRSAPTDAASRRSARATRRRTCTSWTSRTVR